MESCDFWITYRQEGDEAFSVLDKYLPQLIPLFAMVDYSEEEPWIYQ